MAGSLTGVGVSPGVGYGPAVRVVDSVPEPPDVPAAGSADEESAAAEAALEAVAADLEHRAVTAGGEAQQVLEAQAMMARDPSLATQIGAKCTGGSTAARATFEALGAYADMLAASGSDYLAGRVADLHDIRARVVARLLNVPPPGIPELSEPSVLVARDLAPADTAILNKDMVVAFVTVEGGPTSHTSILARNYGIPAVVGCPGALDVALGTQMLVDGTNGAVELEPSPVRVEAALAKDAKRRGALEGAGTGPGKTADGHPVALLANIGGPEDVDAAIGAGAEGVGLFRTELCFLDRAQAPSVAEQTTIYSAVLSGFEGKKVVVRTLDAGADKPLPFMPFGEEPNPAMGVRGLRICMQAPDILATQLTALKNAADATGAELWVMAPMVADMSEAAWFRSQCHRAGLTGPIGIMVEIPAAAMRAKQLSTIANFFSIGSNDLTQYTFAADRQVGAVARLQDAWQPALLDLIALTAEGAADTETPCGVCGEAAGDPLLACVLVGLGVTSLSMSPGSLAAVRTALGAHSLDQCRAAATAARQAVSAAGAREAARTYLSEMDMLGL
ncbi:MAG: phosphoenolpyruvate-protein phosphotransferase system enzyme [Actinomycetota bacterium]|nr:phosphoenolpyruvate-protein phosphotransferase system enzyme [Actinomycetota bacterium]